MCLYGLLSQQITWLLQQTIQDRSDIVCGGHQEHTDLQTAPVIPDLNQGPNSNPSQVLSQSIHWVASM